MTRRERHVITVAPYYLHDLASSDITSFFFLFMVPVKSSMQTNANSQLDINTLTVRVIDGMVANNLD